MTSQASVTIDRERAGEGWRAQIRVLELARGEVFQILAETNGADGYRADYYDAATVQLARAVYDEAVSRLAAHRMPDLRAIAARLKRRDPELVTLVRDADGAQLLGDTSPDEAAGA